MPTLREFFEIEATEHLERLTKLVAHESEVDAKVLHSHVRSLRGSAQMAREDHVYRAALGLEAAARGLLEGGARWTPETGERIRRSLEDLESLIRHDDDGDAEERVAAVLERCFSLGIELPDAGARRGEEDADAAAREEFRTFARHEIAAIADTMDEAIDQFGSNPMDRETLKRVLRRQRALLGAARLDEIPIIGETLRAVEDLSAVIAKINVPVKAQWLDVFRMAREVLRDGHAHLSEGRDPEPIAALSRLRTSREELLDRYGTAEVVSSAAPAGAGLVQAVARVDDAVVPRVKPTAEIGATRRHEGPAQSPTERTSHVSGPALRRALELCEALEATARNDEQARQALAELSEILRAGLAGD